MKPTVFNYADYEKVVEENKKLKAEVANLQIRCRIAEADIPTGEWVWSDEDASWKCGRCDCVFEEIDWKPNYNFCPNCGAKMEDNHE